MSRSNNADLRECRSYWVGARENALVSWKHPGAKSFYGKYSETMNFVAIAERHCLFCWCFPGSMRYPGWLDFANWTYCQWKTIFISCYVFVEIMCTTMRWSQDITHITDIFSLVKSGFQPNPNTRRNIQMHNQRTNKDRQPNNIYVCQSVYKHTQWEIYKFHNFKFNNKVIVRFY